MCQKFSNLNIIQNRRSGITKNGSDNQNEQSREDKPGTVYSQ